MDIGLIRAPHRAKPFLAFLIHTASGETYAVKHPENMSISPDERGLVVMPAGGQVALIDPNHVTEITHDFARKSTSNAET